jgi:large subunit ribosomal protein L13
MRIPFDENVRHNIPVMPNHLQYRFLDGMLPDVEAQS